MRAGELRWRREQNEQTVAFLASLKDRAGVDCTKLLAGGGGAHDITSSSAAHAATVVKGGLAALIKQL